MMTLPLVPAYLLSIMSILIVVLAVPALLVLPEYNREQLLILMAGGIIFLSMAFFVYGILYFYYNQFITEIDVRQRSIRMVLLFLTLIVNAWFLVIIFFKKGVGKLWNS